MHRGVLKAWDFKVFLEPKPGGLLPELAVYSADCAGPTGQEERDLREQDEKQEAHQ